jgi:hypothetical protein
MAEARALKPAMKGLMTLVMIALIGERTASKTELKTVEAVVRKPVNMSVRPENMPVKSPSIELMKPVLKPVICENAVLRRAKTVSHILLHVPVTLADSAVNWPSTVAKEPPAV